MLDIGRASLYRVLDKLESDGFIERKNKTIILKNEKEMLNRYSR
jgi:DNA-binding PadR family transcriptional regulator